MRRLLAASILSLCLLFSAMIVAASSLGSTLEPEAVTVIATHTTQRLYVRLSVQFIELRRSLKVAFLPFTDQNMTGMQLDGPHHAFILARRSIGAQGRTLLALFYVDLNTLNAPISPIMLFPNIALSDIFGVEALSPQWSPDGRWLAYYHPIASQVMVYDTQKSANHTVSTSFPFDVFEGSLSWSPDSSQVAFREAANRLVVANADGSNIRRYDIPDIDTFLPVWSQDSQHILISRSSLLGATAPISIINVNTMRPDAELASIEAVNSQWCDDRWILYSQFDPDHQQMLYVLDTNTHVEQNLISALGLSTQTLWLSSFDSTCEHIFLSTRSQVASRLGMAM